VIARSLTSRGYADPETCPEDAVISDLVRNSGGQVVFRTYQAATADVPDLEAFMTSAGTESSLLHFEGGEKSRMKEGLEALERQRRRDMPRWTRQSA